MPASLKAGATPVEKQPPPPKTPPSITTSEKTSRGGISSLSEPIVEKFYAVGGTMEQLKASLDVKRKKAS